MVFKINTTCMKCGRKPPEVTSFRLISMDESVCSICEPPLLDGACPTCDGHGTVNLFYAWIALNQVSARDTMKIAAFRDAFSKCRTKAAVRDILSSALFLDRYPLLPDWLPV